MTHTALLEFDQKDDRDTFRIYAREHAEQIHEERFPARIKLRGQLDAFLRWTNGEQKDSRLVDVDLGLLLVRINARILQSAEQGFVAL